MLTEHEIDKPSDNNREKTAREKTKKKTTIQKMCSPLQTKKKSKLEERNLQKKMISDSMKKWLQYQPSGEGGARSPPATPHRLQNPKWPPGGPKMADGVWKGVYP